MFILLCVVRGEFEGETHRRLPYHHTTRSRYWLRKLAPPSSQIPGHWFRTAVVENKRPQRFAPIRFI